MRKPRPRRFTVRLGTKGPNDVHIAADPKTKPWADREAGVLQVAVRTLGEETASCQLVRELPPAWMAPPKVAVRMMTLQQVADRFGVLLRLAYPEEAILIVAETDTTAGS